MPNRGAYVESIARRDLGRMDRIVAGKKERSKLGEVLDAEESIQSLLAGQLGGGLSKQNGAIAITESRVVFVSGQESRDWTFPAISYAQHRGSWSGNDLKLFLADGGETTLTNVSPVDRVEQAAEIITERAAGTPPPDNAEQASTAEYQTTASAKPGEDGGGGAYSEEARRITDIKDADRALEALHKEHRSRIESARRSMQEAEESYSNGTMGARQRVAKAEEPRLVAFVGILKRVALFETQIRTPEGTYELTPEVSARAELHGMKQVVQGWIYKSDQDRREIYLHIDGPGWSEVVSYQLKSSSVTPNEIYQLADSINHGARNSDATRIDLRQRTRQATQELIDALLNRAAPERAASRLADVAQSDGRVRAYAAHVEALLSKADRGEPRARKTAERLQRIRSDLRELADAAMVEAQRAAEEGATARREAERLQAEIAATEPPAPHPSRVQPAVTTTPSGQSSMADELAKLVELRDKGILTPEEFDAAKQRVLSS